MRLLACLLLAGCGYQQGFLRDANTVNQHQFQMPVSQVRFVKVAAGSFAITSLFCAIPLDNGAYAEAMKELHDDAKLKPNQVLENIREDHSVMCALIFGITKLTVSADVIEIIYAPPAPPAPPVITTPPTPLEKRD